MTDFSGKTILVTGAASGIGLACAHLLRERGADVAIIDANADACAAMAQGGWLSVTPLDVRDPAGAADLRQRLERDGHIVSGLVNCAGIVQPPDRPENFGRDAFDEVLTANLTGTYTMCREFGGAMAARRSGTIVNIASVAGMRSMPLHAYAPAKAGVISLTECLAAEWGRASVRVNTVSPGYTRTAALRGQIDAGLRDSDRLAGNSALGCLIEPEAIAEGVGFLMSDRAAMITGINLPIDAGWLVAGSWSTFGGVRQPANTPQA